MIRIKSFKDLPLELAVLRKGKKILDRPHEILSEQFRKFFMAYSKAIKIQENRTGSLFEKNFKRIWIRNSSYYTRLINYIHRNPQAHRISQDFRTYPYSSYH